MAITSVGTLGSAASTANNQTSLAITTTAQASVGQLAVVAVAVDNSTGTGGASTDVTSITDSAGANNWIRAIGLLNTNGGAAQDGASCEIWYAVITNQIASGGTITASFKTATTSDASAMSAWLFNITSSKVTVAATNSLSDDAAAAGSLDATTGNIECLRFRATASESNSSTAWTKTAAFDSLIDQAISGAGTSDTEIGIRGEFDISTGTGAASAPTGGAGTADHASVYAAITEVLFSQMRPAGAGSLSGYARLKEAAYATLGGAGSFSVNATIRHSPQVRYEGAGGMSVSTVFAQIPFFQFPINLAPPLRFVPQPELKPFGVPLQAGVQTIEAIFAGAGGFSVASIKVNAQGPVTMPGAGNMSALLLQTLTANSTFSGTGNLSANAQVGTPAQATFAGAGGMSVDLQRVAVTVSGEARFSGAGTLSVNVTQGELAYATFAGSGNLSAFATSKSAAYATFAGAGGLSVDLQKVAVGQVGEARFGGSGGFSVNVTQTHAAFATFAGAGNFSSATTQSLLAYARFVGAGNLSVDLQQTSAAGVIWGWHRISDGPPPRKPPRVSAFSMTIVFPIADIPFWQVQTNVAPRRLDIPQPILLPFGVPAAPAAPANIIEARFSGVGSMSAAVTSKLAAQATFGGSGGFSVNVVKAGVQTAESTFSGAGNLSANVTQQHVQGATFGGAGGFSVNVTVIRAAQAIFGGTGNLSADVTKRGMVDAAATFSGIGSLSINTIQKHVEGARFAGAGSLSVYAAQLNQALATFAGSGTLSVDVTKLAKQADTRFNGSGLLSVSTIQQHAGYATFSGAGTFSIAVKATYDAGIRFTGTGAMLISAAVRQAAQARFDGAGALSVQVAHAKSIAAQFGGASTFRCDLNVIPFGTFQFGVTFNGQGGMRVDAVVFGPRHVSTGIGVPLIRSSRPAQPTSRRPQQPPARRTGT